MFPPPLKQIFPYRLLIQPSETQIGAVLHESFHVYQTQIAPERLKTAEAIHRVGDQYNSAAESFSAEFTKESALLAQALKADSRADKIDLVRQFIDQRAARRTTYRLDPNLVDYERWLEWEEGTAKYIEVASLKQAFETSSYQPLEELVRLDSDFKAYKNFGQRWSQEMIQLQYVTTAGEQQFYMSGMAEAFLLDDLLPGWKDQYWNEDVFLEDLLAMAIKP